MEAAEVQGTAEWPSHTHMTGMYALKTRGRERGLGEGGMRCYVVWYGVWWWCCVVVGCVL